MIAGLYACGPNGEFGLNGKLPWGSFKEELEVFKATLTYAKNSSVIIGIKTWETLPASVKKLLVDLNIEVYLYVPNPKRHIQTLKEYMGHMFIITKFDVSISEFMSKDRFSLILGGASTLKDAMDAGILDGLYISRVWTLDGSPLEADTYLDESLWNEESIPEATVFLTHFAEGDKYAFVQEHYFFGTV